MRPVALCDAHTHIYRRQPLLVALAVCNSPVRKPDYLHRLPGVNDIILSGVVDGAGVEPTSLRRRASAVFQPSKLTFHVAEITRPAIGV